MLEKNIMNLMNDIVYGWVDKNGLSHLNDFETFSSDYRLQSPEELIKSKIGVCWDQVELERYYFEKENINVKTYFLVHYDGGKCPTHTFLVFRKNDKYYWFEHSWDKFKGIHEYSTLKELLSDVRNKFIKYELNNNYVDEYLVLHEYEKPSYSISVQDFFTHCDNGKYIEIDTINWLD